MDCDSFVEPVADDPVSATPDLLAVDVGEWLEGATVMRLAVDRDTTGPLDFGGRG